MTLPAQGAIVVGEGRTRFRVWAPHAEQVVVVLNGRTEPLARGERGYFSATLPATPGDRYRYRLDDRAPLADPASRWQPEGVHGPSAVDDPRFDWTDAGWRGIPLEQVVLSELHVGAFTEAGTLDAAAEHLPELARLGITAVELMPLSQFPGERNWGYDGVFPNAVQDSYGGPVALRRFVDAAHAAGLAVVLDVVYNHLGPEGNVLPRFGPYLTDRYATPWGPGMNVDQSGSDEVRRFLIDNALMWFADYHVDGLRLDAIHGIVDASARPFLRELADEVHALGAHAGRPHLLFAESDANDPSVVDPHGLGMDAQWSDDFHHVLHVLLTGERAGYYADYHGADDLVLALREGFVLNGRYTSYRGRRHGASSAGIEPHRLVIAAQNHDQVGNRLKGERLITLAGPEKARLAAAMVLLAPFTPLLFMGEEWGEESPFQFFVDHSESALVDAVRAGRAQEFSSFGWDEEPPDPFDEKTFLRSKLDRSARGTGAHAEMEVWVRDLLALRKRLPAGAHEVGHDRGVIALTRSDGEHSVRALFNLTDRTVECPAEPGWEGLLGSTPGAPLTPWGVAVFEAHH